VLLYREEQKVSSYESHTHSLQGRGSERLEDSCCKSLFFSGRRVVAVALDILFQVLALHFYGTPEFDAWYLPAPYLLVDPALAHPYLLADLRDREQLVFPSGLGSKPTLNRGHLPLNF
jgi:hypothetical protein